MLTGTAMEAEKETVSLSLRGLQVSAPNGRALVHASNMTIGPGVTALVGSNGSGKSTLLRALATLHPLAGGSVVLNGTDIARDPRTFLQQ